VLTFGAGPWYEYDLVREKLKDEILALDAAGVVRQSGAGHVMIFARASKWARFPDKGQRNSVICAVCQAALPAAGRRPAAIIEMSFAMSQSGWGSPLGTG
jgi:hypothetical protein